MTTPPSGLKRILFVDDEQALLEALRRVLRPLRAEWDVQIESSPAAALARLDLEPFDVVVADMRMPDLDGVSVLTHVMQKHPDIIRLVLSGHAELESAMRAVPVAHQFLAKPCDAETLKSTIQRISRMRDRMRDSSMRSLLGEIDGLPALPSVCRDLDRTLARKDFSTRDVAEVVEQDSALCAKVLQIVNSSFFGLARKISHVHDAVAYLGTGMLKHLVTSVTMWRAVEGKRPGAISEIQRVHTHSQAVAMLARRIMGRERLEAEAAFAAGLLHDLGAIVLIAYLPERFGHIQQVAHDRGVTFEVAEADLYDVSHAEIGAYLLDAWGIPFNVLEAVAQHHHAPALQHDKLECADAVYIAQTLCSLPRPRSTSSEPGKHRGPRTSTGRDSQAQGPVAALAAEYLARIGRTEELKTWVHWLAEA